MILVNLLIILLSILIIFYLSGVFMRFLSYLGFRVREGLENNDASAKGTDASAKGTDASAKGTDASAKGTDATSNTTSSSSAKDTDKKTYTDPGLNDNPLYLATLNAANIGYLKEQIDELNNLKQQVKTLETQVDQNTKGISAMGEQFALSAQQLTGRDPNSKEPIPMATGLD
jgi:hypothetical protein